MNKLVENPEYFQNGHRYDTRDPVQESEKALAFEVHSHSSGSSMLWLPKSQIHAEGGSGHVTVWVAEWLVEKKPRLKQLKDPE